MFKKAILFYGLVSLASSSYAQTLCAETEKPIFSFQQNKSKKLMSVCKGLNSAYLTYRFGTKEKIELQFPSQLDASSWRKFEFSGRRRGGGKANAGFGDYSLAFSNDQTEYVIFQEWSGEDDTYSIGINVQANGKSTTLSGNKKTQLGSLVLLESENKNIRNAANE